MVNFRINDTRQIPPVPIHRGLVEDADESAPVRLETAPTGGQKCSFIFNIHHNKPMY